MENSSNSWYPEGSTKPTTDGTITWGEHPDRNGTMTRAMWMSEQNLSSRVIFGDTGQNWLEQDYPDWELPKDAQSLLIALYSITTLLAVVGNILVIAVLVFGNRVKTELTVFLVNLAVADLIMAFFCMPFTFTKVMLGRWMFGAFMCTYVSFMQVTSVAVSIFTNMAIGIDRFWGVIYPLKPKLTKTRAKFVLIGIWFAAMALASPQLFVAKSTVQIYNAKQYWDCDEKWHSEKSRHSYTLAVLLLTYIKPLLVLCFTYYKVGTKLWVRNAPGNAHQSRDQILLRSKRKIVKMVVTLVVVFAVCWLPLHLFTLLLDFAPHLSVLLSPREEHIFFGIYYSCHWLAMANSFVNPIIYSFLNESFRADLKMLLSWLPCIKRMRDPSADTFARTMSTRTSTRAFFSRVESKNSRPASSNAGRGRHTRGVSECSVSSPRCMFEMHSDVPGSKGAAVIAGTQTRNDPAPPGGTNGEPSYETKLRNSCNSRVGLHVSV